MKVLELYENRRISTAKEFKDSFTPEQWSEILCQLVSISKETIGISGGLVNQDPDNAATLRSRFEKELGPGISDRHSTSAWNSTAMRYRILTTGNTWQSFHNHLKQYVGKPCNITFGTPNSINPAQRNVQIASQVTPESIDDIIGASPNLPDPMTYDQAIVFRTNAYDLVKNSHGRNTPDAQGFVFKDWVLTVSTTVAAPEGDAPDLRKVIYNRLLEVIPEETPEFSISKKDLAIKFLAWLRMTDGYIKTSRERFEQD